MPSLQKNNTHFYGQIKSARDPSLKYVDNESKVKKT